MSDMVWIISMATADGIACSIVPPTISHAARQSTGRTRLPPANSEYLGVRIQAWTEVQGILRAGVLGDDVVMKAGAIPGGWVDAP